MGRNSEHQTPFSTILPRQARIKSKLNVREDLLEINKSRFSSEDDLESLNEMKGSKSVMSLKVNSSSKSILENQKSVYQKRSGRHNRFE